MAKWKNIAVKLDPDVFAEAQQFFEDGGYDSMGSAFRHLIASGLEQLSGLQGVEERTERKNAQAAARRRLHLVMSAAMKSFSSGDEFFEEDEENYDVMFDYEED